MDKPISRSKWFLLGCLLALAAIGLALLLLRAAGVLQLSLRWRDTPTHIEPVHQLIGSDCVVMVWEYRGGWIDCEVDASGLGIAQVFPGGLGAEVQKQAIANGVSADGRDVTGVLILTGIRRSPGSNSWHWRCSLTALSPRRETRGYSVRDNEVRLDPEKLDEQAPTGVGCWGQDLVDVDRVVGGLEWGHPPGKQKEDVQVICRKLSP